MKKIIRNPIITGFSVFFALLFITDSAGAGGIALMKDTLLNLPSPKEKNMLFYLQRDLDANTVIYQLNLQENGSVCSDHPVKGYWIRYNENGRRRELNGIEKKFAYGIQSKPLGKDEYEIRFISYKKMPFYLKKSVNNRYYVYAHIDDQLLILKRVFVHINGGTFWFPNIEYIELLCSDAITGQEFVKQIKI